MRFFVGIELAIPVIDRLALLQDEVGEETFSRGARVRWTPVEHIRLNLKVFEAVDAGIAQRLQEMLTETASYFQTFRFDAVGTQADRVAGQARIVTTQLHDSSNTLQSLRDHIERQADRVGFQEDHAPWQPAVLLGRLATPDGPADVDALLHPYRNTPWGQSECRELVLYRSQLVGREARTRVVRRFAVGDAR